MNPMDWPASLLVYTTIDDSSVNRYGIEKEES